MLNNITFFCNFDQNFLFLCHLPNSNKPSLFLTSLTYFQPAVVSDAFKGSAKGGEAKCDDLLQRKVTSSNLIISVLLV